MKKLHISRCQCRKPASSKQPNSPLPRRGRAGTGFARILCAAIRQRTAKPALAFLLLTALSAHAITLELELDGQIHGVPVENLQLRAESGDYQHWHLSGKLPATRLANTPLKNTVLDARLRRDGDSLVVKTLALRSQRGKTTLQLTTDRILLQHLLRGELQLPPGATLRLQADKQRLQATPPPVAPTSPPNCRLPSCPPC